jgi:hypothetical protein
MTEYPLPNDGKPGVSSDDVRNDIKEGNYYSNKPTNNGLAEVYNTPGGARIIVNTQEEADFFSGNTNPDEPSDTPDVRRPQTQREQRMEEYRASKWADTSSRRQVEDSEIRKAHGKELRKNDKLNENFKPTGGMSEGWNNFASGTNTTTPTEEKGVLNTDFMTPEQEAQYKQSLEGKGTEGFTTIAPDEEKQAWDKIVKEAEEGYNQEAKERNDKIRQFRDQDNVGKNESLPISNPMTTDSITDGTKTESLGDSIDAQIAQSITEEEPIDPGSLPDDYPLTPDITTTPPFIEDDDSIREETTPAEPEVITPETVSELALEDITNKLNSIEQRLGELQQQLSDLRSGQDVLEAGQDVNQAILDNLKQQIGFYEEDRILREEQNERILENLRFETEASIAQLTQEMNDRFDALLNAINSTNPIIYTTPQVMSAGPATSSVTGSSSIPSAAPVIGASTPTGGAPTGSSSIPPATPVIGASAPTGGAPTGSSSIPPATPVIGASAPTAPLAAPGTPTPGFPALPAVPTTAALLAGMSLEDQERLMPADIQRLMDINAQIAVLQDKYDNGSINNNERIDFLNLMIEQRDLQGTLNQAEAETQKKRARKERIIKWTAGAVAAGIAIATPALSVAAVIGITLGGKFAGKQLKNLENRIRTKTKEANYVDRSTMTIDQLEKLSKKIRRRNFWSDRLGEVSSVLIGGATGYGIGAAVKNLFNIKDIFGGGSQGTNVPTNNPTVNNNTPGNTPSNLPSGYNEPLSENLISTMKPPVVEPPIPTEIVNNGWLKASEYGWDFSKLGWQGDNLALGAQGGNYGNMQKSFFDALQNLGVDKAMLQGQDAGNIFTQGLRQVYNGSDPLQAAQSAANALKGL